jgi:NAD(P)H-flavin reductase
MSADIPRSARIEERVEETTDTVTLRLRLDQADGYRFTPGQFNMLYLPGCGEVPISIVGIGEDDGLLSHTVRAVGRVTRGLCALRPGERIGLRGPFGRGWPLHEARDHDIVVVTGGLGCAPSVSVIQHVLRHRGHYGRLAILQGVRHASDLIWRERYAAWAALPDVEVHLAADTATPGWTGHVGLVTALFDRIALDNTRTVAMLCGPEIMMRASAENLHARGLPATAIHVSMERNMQCGQGLCGHCQLGPCFVCRDGPVFPWPAVRDRLCVAGS